MINGPDSKRRRKDFGKKRFNTPTVSNWPVQSHGADLMRLAAVFASEKGVRIAAPVHDAFLITASTAEIEEQVQTMRQAMNHACQYIFDGEVIPTSIGDGSGPVHYPDRFYEPGGEKMWNQITNILGKM